MTRGQRRAHERRPRRKPIYRRWWLWTVVGLLILVVGGGAWIGVRAVKAKDDLEAAVPLVTELKTQIVDQKPKAAKATYQNLSERVSQAKSYTSDPVWRTAELIPVLGKNLKVVRVLASSTDGLVGGVLQPLMQTASGLSFDSLKPVNGKINTAVFVKAAKPISLAAHNSQAELRAIKALNVSHTLPMVVSAKSSLQSELAKATSELTTVKSLIEVVPDILGVGQSRNYLLLFQSNGELTAGGGTIGSMVLLNVNNGDIQLQQQASASYTEFPSPYPAPVIQMSADMHRLYPYGLATQVQDVTQTPRFSQSFKMVQAMWAQTKGVQIDGAVAIDTVGLSEILKATGPVPLLPGLELTSQNATQLLLGDLYTKYDEAQVDAINYAAASEVFNRISSGDVNPKLLLGAVEEMGSEHRLLLWTTNTQEQKLIKKSEFYGSPPAQEKGTNSFGIYFRDETPSKMEYYLRQKVDLAQQQCSPGGTRDVRITVSLTNAAPADAATTLPSYVTGGGKNNPAGDINLAVYAYSPPGFKVLGMQINSQDATPTVGNDGKYAVATGTVLIPPGGATSTITFLVQASAGGVSKLAAQMTPTVSPTTITQSTWACPAAEPSATPTPSS